MTRVAVSGGMISCKCKTNTLVNPTGNEPRPGKQEGKVLPGDHREQKVAINAMVSIREKHQNEWVHWLNPRSLAQVVLISDTTTCYDWLGWVLIPLNPQGCTDIRINFFAVIITRIWSWMRKKKIRTNHFLQVYWLKTSRDSWGPWAIRISVNPPNHPRHIIQTYLEVYVFDQPLKLCRFGRKIKGMRPCFFSSMVLSPVHKRWKNLMGFSLNCCGLRWIPGNCLICYLVIWR